MGKSVHLRSPIFFHGIKLDFILPILSKHINYYKQNINKS